MTIMGCNTPKEANTPPSKSEPVEAPVHAVGYGDAKYLPKAVIYKTNGDYTQHVMVALTPDRKALSSYPAISDVTVASAPLDLGDGWLLDRQGGAGPNSAFLAYTYQDYSHLGTQPSARELYDKIIPGAEVIRVVALPITLSEALAHPEKIRQYLPQ